MPEEVEKPATLLWHVIRPERPAVVPTGSTQY